MILLIHNLLPQPLVGNVGLRHRGTDWTAGVVAGRGGPRQPRARAGTGGHGRRGMVHCGARMMMH